MKAWKVAAVIVAGLLAWFYLHNPSFQRIILPLFQARGRIEPPAPAPAPPEN